MNLNLFLAALLLTIAHPASAVIGQNAEQEQALAKSAVIGQDTEQEQVLSEAELLASLAGDYTTIKQPDRAIQLLEEALSFNQTLANPCHRVEILTNVAGHYALAGQETRSSALFAQAQKILDTTEYCGSKPSSTAKSDPKNWVIAAATRHAVDGRHDIALKIATSFGDKYLESMLLGLLSAYADSDSRQPDRAAEIQLKLADYYNRTGQSDKAVQIWLALVNYYNEIGQLSRSRTLTAVANLYSSLEKDTEAAKLLHKALSELQAGAENLRSDARFEANRALEEIIAGYLRIGQIAQALEVAQLVQTGKLNLAASDFSEVQVDSNFAYQSLMPPIVAFYAQTGQFEQALQLANTLGKGHRDKAFLGIAEQYASKGQYAQALKTTQMIKGLEFQNKTNIIYSIIERAIKAEKLDWAVQATQTIDWTKQATQATGQTIDGATNESRFYRNKLLLAIAREYAQLRQFNRAIEAVNMMSSDEMGNYRRVKALSAIAREYAQAEQSEKAIKLLEQAVAIARSMSSLNASG